MNASWPSRGALLAALLTAAQAAAPASASWQSARPNAPDQRPAFPGQTRALEPAERLSVATEVLADALPRLWALALLPDGRMIVTEKAGALRLIGPDGRSGASVAGVPKVDARGQGGLLDVALSPGFAQDRLVYLSFSEPRTRGNGTSVARGRLVEEGGQARLDGLQEIFRQEPAWTNNLHFGSRLVFAPDGTLFVTVGERSDRETRVYAQDLGYGWGKVFRINPDGSIPKDNPFVGRVGAQPAIWSYGHRNMQSAALDGQGRLWTVEHGPKGGDELNRPEPGRNYGWPEVTYGVEYSGRPVGSGLTAREGTEQPVYYWDPVIAPSGMAFYGRDLFPGLRGTFLIGGLQAEGVVVLRLEGDRVASEELIPIGARVRDVRVAPDGAILVVTEGQEGSRILRLRPPP